MARILLRLWQMRRLVVLGLVIAGVAGFGAMKLLHKETYAGASTQLLVGSPGASVGSAATVLTGAEALAPVYTQLLTSDQVLAYVGKAARIPGNLIEAVGPVQVNGAPQTIRMPTAVPGEPIPTGKPQYILNLTQNPALPTIEVATQAPSTKQAIALADAAAKGLTDFLARKHAKGSTSDNAPVTQLGRATGGVVDPSAGKSIAVIVAAIVFFAWCGFLLWITRLASEIRNERRLGLADGDEPAPNAATEPQPSFGTYRVPDTATAVYTLVPNSRQIGADLRAAEDRPLAERSADSARTP